MKKVLVTGGAGFIGSNLCERLIKRGDSCAIIDNFSDYYSPSYKESNIDEIRKTAKLNGIPADRLSLYREDIRDASAMKRVFAEYKPDAVIHLAACAGVRPSIADPRLYCDVNLNGTLNLLECIRESGVKNFVFASSSSVYGNNKKTPFSEADIVDFPISPYAATKKSGELICHTYHHLYGINTVCLRFFTVYGRRQRPDLAISKFTRLILRGEPIPFFGDGTTRRDYTYIDDITDGVVRALDYTYSHNAPVYDIFNLGESRTISLSEMVATIENALGKKAVLETLPSVPGDVEITYADISKARGLLGYSPSTSFEEGIASFVKWYLAYRDPTAD